MLVAPILTTPFAHRSRRYKLAKKTVVAVADALERTVPLQDILANAVWLGDEDVIRKYSGTLQDEHKERRWFNKFAFVGSNPLPEADEPALKIGPLSARLNHITEKVRVGNGANSRCRPSLLPLPPPFFPSLSTCRSTRPFKHFSVVCCT